MKRFLIPLILLNTPMVWADEFTLQSQVTDVTVYGQGAKISRTVKLDVQEGTHVLRIQDLPKAFDTSSLQVNANSMSVTSLDFRNTRQTVKIEQKPANQVRAEVALAQAQDALRALDEQIAQANGQITAAQLQLDFLRALAGGNTGVFGEDTGIGADQVGAVVAELGSKAQAALTQITQAQTQLAVLQRGRADLVQSVNVAQINLEAATPLQRQTGSLSISITSDVAYSGPLNLTYFVWDAGWQPSYEISLDQDETKGKLQIERRAIVRQGTQEDWNDVQITLSTAQIGARLGSIEPNSDLRFLFDPAKYSVRSSVPRKQVTMDAPLVEPVVEEMAADVSGMTSNVGILRGQTIEFDLVGVNSLDGDGVQKLFSLDQIESDLNLTAIAIANAARDDTAYLVADFTNATGGAILAGQAYLYRDGVLMGETFMPAMVVGEETALELGPLDGIQLERNILKVEDGDVGIISSSNQRLQRYETEITSTLAYDIPLSVLDVLPTSESEDLVISMQAAPKPSRTDVNGERGILAWDVEMNAGTKRKIAFGYQLRWPTDQQIGNR